MKLIYTLILIALSSVCFSQTVKEILMFNEINVLRSNPSTYVEKLNDYKQVVIGKRYTDSDKVEILEKIEKAIVFLSKAKGVDTLTLSNKNFAINISNGSHTANIADSLYYRCWGENITNNINVDCAMLNLVISPAHRANMLNPKFKTVSVVEVNGKFIQLFTDKK